MLILTRRSGQTVMIGDGVTVTVLEVKGGRTRLGINAPKDVSVQREEVYRRGRHAFDSIPEEETMRGKPPVAAL
ncbi:MAG TPA: carbon storage regulator CsrA [Gammaproteobacteria bacterium]|nr:carbon storage regulator CsrA [Gammaproteobacteria bacterium]